MTQKIYLSPAVADVVDERMKQVIDELKTLRLAIDEDAELEAIDSEEDDG